MRFPNKDASACLVFIIIGFQHNSDSFPTIPGHASFYNCLCAFQQLFTILASNHLYSDFWGTFVYYFHNFWRINFNRLWSRCLSIINCNCFFLDFVSILFKLLLEFFFFFFYPAFVGGIENWRSFNNSNACWKVSMYSFMYAPCELKSATFIIRIFSFSSLASREMGVESPFLDLFLLTFLQDYITLLVNCSSPMFRNYVWDE